ncbi:hypothetical protein ACTU44_13105 [Thalassospira sp. SM2505]
MADSSFFQTWAGTVAAGDTLTIHRRGRSIACIAATQGLELVINDGSRSKFFAGASLTFDREFEKIQIYNPNGTAVDFEIWTAMGRVDDNRLTASGNLNVLDPVTGDSFAEVIACQADILAMMQNKNDQREPVSVVGESFLVATGFTTALEVISPASNVAGVIVRTCYLYPATGEAALFADTAAPSTYNDATKRKFHAGGGAVGSGDIKLPIFIKPGDGLYLIGTDASGRAALTWDVLS